MKRFLIITVFLGIVLGFCIGNQEKDNNTDITEQDVILRSSAGLSISEQLDNADIVINGKVDTIELKSGFEQLIVKVNKTYKGSDDLQIIELLNYDLDEKSRYKVGDEYFFIIQCIYSVYEEKNVILADSYISPDDKEKNEFIMNYAYNEKGVGDKLTIDYFKNVDKQYIYSHSKYLVKIQLDDFLFNTEVTDIFSASIIDDYNENIHTDINGLIIVPLFKSDKYNKGDVIIVGLNSDVDDSVIYSLSAENAVFDESEFNKFREDEN